MNDTKSTRPRTAGTRVPADWQPRHVGGSIEHGDWKGWALDPARPLAHLALAYLRDCRDRMLALGTIEDYDRVVGSFTAFVEDQPAPHGAPARATRIAAVDDLHTTTIHRYLKRTGARGSALTIGAQRSEAGPLRSMANFGITIGAVAPTALAAFKSPKPHRTVPTTLSDADVRRLDKRLREDRTIEGIRLLLWCRLAIDGMARPAEQAGVLLPEMDQARRTIVVHGKNGEDRTIHYEEETAQALALWLRVRGESEQQELFLGHRGPMGPEAISHEFREVADELGLVGRACTDPDGRAVEDAPPLYVLRRTGARLFADGGGLIEDLMLLMGHRESSLPMLLRVYYSPSNARVRRAHQRIRPLDRVLGDVAE